jgi:hypothetical protein
LEAVAAVEAERLVEDTRSNYQAWSSQLADCKARIGNFAGLGK